MGSQDLEFETAMNLEREERVKQLEVDIIDINEIMRDLSSMVTAQGDVVGKSHTSSLQSMSYPLSRCGMLRMTFPFFIHTSSIHNLNTEV